MAVKSSYRLIEGLCLVDGKLTRKLYTWEEALATFEALKRRDAEKREVEQGRLESMRWAIQRVLRKRFGIEPGALGDRLEGIADLKALDELFAKAIDARSFDELQLAF